MNKTIIVIAGRANEGKSSTIKEVCRQLIANYPSIKYDKEINFKGDVLVVFSLGKVKIGVESQGDPYSRMIYDDTLKFLVKEKCDIILCATRTSGSTVVKVEQIAEEFDYHKIWLSSFFSPSLNIDVLNKKQACNIINLISSIIVNQL